MPQFTRFPFVPAGPPGKSIEQLISAIQSIPEQGEPFREFRSRLKSQKLWKATSKDDLGRFFQLDFAKTVTPSELVSALQAATSEDAGKQFLAERLWTTNPLLFKTVLELVSERPHTRDELFTYVSSFAYPGEAVARDQMQNWVQLAIGLDIVKVIGIALMPDERGHSFMDRVKDFEVDEFLEDDEPEPELSGVDEPPEAAPPAATTESVAAVPAQAPQTVTKTAPAPVQETVSYPSPLGRGRPIAIARFASDDLFADDVIDDNKQLLGEWWAEQTPEPGRASAEDFGIDGDLWLEGADEALYRLAVAAALAFRLGRDQAAVVAAYRGLNDAGVLADLYFGTAPASLPAAVDSQALMLASLVARRCAESPELAVTLEKQKSAKEAFQELEKALGRGLFSLELFWMMRSLGDIGALRFDDLRALSTLPTRRVRDTLYRLGFIGTAYASSAASLVTAAEAASRATDTGSPDAVLEAFALAAGCQYDCPNRRRCEYACRERGELSL